MVLVMWMKSRAMSWWRLSCELWDEGRGITMMWTTAATRAASQSTLSFSVDVAAGQAFTQCAMDGRRSIASAR